MRAKASVSTAQSLRPGRSRPRWSAVVVGLAAAAAEGEHAVAVLASSLARPLLGADAAALVRWQDGRATLLAGDPDLAAVLHPRPPEGPGWADGFPVAAMSVDPRTDLVVTRRAPVAFGGTDLEVLRALATLIGWTVPERAADVVLQRHVARIVGSLEPDEVLVAVADATAHLMRAEITGVLMRVGEGGEDVLEMRCAIGNTEPGTDRLRIRAGQGLAGRVLATRRPGRITDYSSDPQAAPEFFALSDVEGTCAAIAVPLPGAGPDAVPDGVLCAWRRRRTPFTDDDEGRLAALADLAGGAIRNASAHQQNNTRTQQVLADHRALQERHADAERRLHVHAELTRIATEGEDIRAVVRVVSALADACAAVVADDGRLLAAASRGTADPRGGRNLLAQVDLAVDREVHGGHGNGYDRPAVTRPGDGTWLLVQTVRAAGVTFGRLALQLDRAPGPAEYLAAEQAAVVCALLLAREEAAVAASRRVQSEFVWDLLEGRLPDAVAAMVRARHLGMGFALPARVVAIQVAGLEEGPRDPEQLERLRATCARLVAQAFAAARLPGAVLARRADLLAAVVPCSGERGASDLRTLAGALAAVRWPDGLGATVGVGGRVPGMGGFPRGWHEAQLARSAAGGPGGAPGVFEDLGVLRFLLAPTSRADLDGFANGLLGPLVDYDSTHGSALLPTLVAHVEAGCSTRRTATVLCVHHRTVSYRLQRVTDLTGLRLDDPEDRFRVQLACKILAL